MASTISPPPTLNTLSFHRVRSAHPTTCKAQAYTRAHGRRQLLLSLTATVSLIAKDLPSLAEDIPIFGLRKKLKSAEEGAVEIVKEGLETAEKGIETAEREIESAVSFGGLAQAGVVAGAEVVGVLVATSLVNGILGPEGQKS
ncbi:hypothetical protein CFOL_v3_30197 [Cephalotus follicularis]|uniref:Uncharacterized protein n=1 Tax=Cephalotus follicularis TaxID=3775 RepID=A0A1Q3D2Y4_CEPFO|nr:hypothetical protein CFOL_v3_30197 [Cephalotus follicularis]